MSKRERKNRTLVIYAIIMLVSIAIMSLVFCMQRNTYVRISNEKIGQIVNDILEKYPNVKEEDIVKILLEDKASEDKVLYKYGLKDTAYIKKLDSKMNEYIIIDVILILLTGFSFIAAFLDNRRKENNKIKEINKYLDEINNKNYELKIEDNGENELSRLRNELYKTTVLLKTSAEESEKEKQKLSDSLADISHQLKTPLTSIRILLDNIEDNENMDANTRKDFIKEISRQVDWMSSLVILLLKLARLDANAVKLERKEIDVKLIINDVISSLAIIVEIKNITFDVDVPENAKFVGDYKWEKEALSNIIKNAIEHSKENSKICIKVENSSVMLKIKIVDEGEGMDKETMKHIFERFFKTKNSNESSVGIGLPLAKSIIERDNGYISVDSKIGDGTKFEIKYLK